MTDPYMLAGFITLIVLALLGLYAGAHDQHRPISIYVFTLLCLPPQLVAWLKPVPILWIPGIAIQGVGVFLLAERSLRRWHYKLLNDVTGALATRNGTLSLAEIIERTSRTRLAIAFAIAGLERDRWIERTDRDGGFPTMETRYRLRTGCVCGKCEKHERAKDGDERRGSV